MTIALSPGMIEVRYVRMDGAGGDDYNRLSVQLTAEERKTADQYLTLPDKLASTAARVLLRRTLSVYANEPADGWRFTRNDHGKPAILRVDAATPDLQFNISHCPGMVAVAVALGYPVGIDVESTLHTNIDYTEIAKTHFSADENHLLASHIGNRQRELFYELWTLKEAYLKARGQGIPDKLTETSFTLNPPAVSFALQSAGAPCDWFLQQEKLTPVHVMAVAAQHKHQDEALVCRIREVVLSKLF